MVFDCLDHELLESKLRSKGLSSQSISWFESYLRNRIQCVRYNNALSDPLPLASAVSQNNAYRPLLFSIFANDLLNSLLDGICLAYADDLTFNAAGKSLEDAARQLQSLLNTHLIGSGVTF